MKLHNDPIHVTLGADGLPTSYRWRGRDYPVLNVIDRWVLQSKWWTQEGEERRDYLLVEATGMDGAACTAEIFARCEEWVLGSDGVTWEMNG